MANHALILLEDSLAARCVAGRAEVKERIEMREKIGGFP
jgi:hypothetical protein